MRRLCLLPLLALMFPLCVVGQEAPASSPSSAPVVAASTQAVAGVCGDGVLAPGEACDDGNSVADDGCSSLCQLAEAKPKSAAAAFGLSLGASAASVGVIIAGSAIAEKNEVAGFAVSILGTGLFVLAPSAGHFYVGEKRHGLIFSGVRLGTGVVAVLGGGFALTSIFGEANALSKVGGTMLVLGILGGAGLLVYDVIDAPRAAKRINLALPEKRASVSLLPTLLSSPQSGPLSGRALVPGLSLGLRF